MFGQDPELVERAEAGDAFAQFDLGRICECQRSGRLIQTGPPNQLVWMERGSVGDARISESRRDA